MGIPMELLASLLLCSVFIGPGAQSFRGAAFGARWIPVLEFRGWDVTNLLGWMV